MKNFILVLTIGLLTFSSYSQKVVSITNDTPTDYQFIFYSSTPSNCGSTTQDDIVVPANSSFLYYAPSGNEFIFARVFETNTLCGDGPEFQLSRQSSSCISCPQIASDIFNYNTLPCGPYGGNARFEWHTSNCGGTIRIIPA